MEYSRLIDKEKILKFHASIIGGKVKKLREEKKWTPLDLSFYSNCAPQTIYNVESGAENITLKTLVSISVALEIELSELFV